MSHPAFVSHGYGPARIFLHWLSAAVILWGLAAGFGVSFLGRETVARQVVDELNPQLATLFIPFFLWRAGLYLAGRPWRGWRGGDGEARLARLVHALLYGLIAAVLASGVLMIRQPWKLLGLVPMPAPFGGQEEQLAGLFALHESLCLMLLALAGLHLAAVAWHEGRGRPVLARMMRPGR